MVLMLQGGGRSLEDLRELKDGEELMKLMGRDKIPKSDTVGGWLRRMGDSNREEPGLEGLDRVRGKINKRILTRDGLQEYTLDADAMEIVGEKDGTRGLNAGEKGCSGVSKDELV